MTTHNPAQDGSAPKITVTHGENGWEVTEERDNHVVRRGSYRDWHRVERAVGRVDPLPARGSDPTV